jgi:signal transduction histidine kinase
VPRPRPDSAPALLVGCAALSGVSALTLELLWGRELALAFGSSQYAVATVLAAFMLGLGLGSFLGGRLADWVTDPARATARIELTLAVAGPLWSIGLLRLPALAAAILPEAGDATRPAFLIGRLLTAVIVLALPTMLMGAGFPLLARAAARSVPELHHGIGRLVAGATLGGVAGVIATGFVVLPRAGVPGAAAFAAAANLGAAIAALSAQRAIFGRQERRDATPAPPLELDRTAISRIESGRKLYQLEEHDLADVVRDVLQAWAPRLEREGFVLELTAPADALPPVRIDEAAIGHALGNLLDNAIKYSGSGRRIAVTLAADGGELAVAVKDFGIGIPREEHERIFDRFHRVGWGLVHDVKGSGLGLAIVKHIADAHGGSVTVESSPGNGSVFALHLPVAGGARISGPAATG